MRDHDIPQGFAARFALITFVVVLVIFYGSLYPFHFHFRAGEDPLTALLATWRGPLGRGDFLANVLLYLPLGLFAVQIFRSWPALLRVSLATAAGVSLSIVMELIQFYDEGRVSALSDVYANTAGALFGSLAGLILFQRSFSWRAGKLDRRPFVLLLLGCWLGYRFFPYLPVIDLHKYWNAVKPLLFSPVLSPVDLYRHISMWLALGLLIEALTGAVRSRLILPALVMVTLFARILILDAYLSPAEVAGGVIAALVWMILVSRIAWRGPLVAMLFAVMVALEALQPFEFNAVARPFNWIPFSGFLHGSLEVNVQSFLEKAFVYGALVWLIARAGANWLFAMIFSTAFVFALHAAQVFLPGRSAEITDTILVLSMACAMKLMGEDPARGAAPLAA